MSEELPSSEADKFEGQVKEGLVAQLSPGEKHTQKSERKARRLRELLERVNRARPRRPRLREHGP